MLTRKFGYLLTEDDVVSGAINHGGVVAGWFGKLMRPGMKSRRFDCWLHQAEAALQER
jgi:hypothetical protein